MFTEANACVASFFIIEYLFFLNSVGAIAPLAPPRLRRPWLIKLMKMFSQNAGVFHEYRETSFFPVIFQGPGRKF